MGQTYKKISNSNVIWRVLRQRSGGMLWIGCYGYGTFVNIGRSMEWDRPPGQHLCPQILLCCPVFCQIKDGLQWYPFKLQKLPRWVKVRSSGHLSFHVNSFKHANFSDLRKQKVGETLEIPLSNFIIVLKRNVQPGRWGKAGGLWRLLRPWPTAEGWTRGWLAPAVSPDRALVDGSSKVLCIQLKIAGPYIVLPVDTIP